jgi:hypothetical protein
MEVERARFRNSELQRRTLLEEELEKEREEVERLRRDGKKKDK